MYQIDHGSLNTFYQKKLELPYGSGRADTNGACNRGNVSGNDNNTGYGGVVNWNAYSAGQHQFKLWVDGILSSSHPFYVAKTQSEFQTGLSAEIIVPNFPSTRDTSTLRWSEADQNFILVETQSD